MREILNLEPSEDIILGGFPFNPTEHNRIVSLGGLYVIGTERRESKRKDDMLRSLCGRGGDPGDTRFYVSFEDDLLKLFGLERISEIFGKIGIKEGEAIESDLVTRKIEDAQGRVEVHNLDMRRLLVDFDLSLSKARDVINDLRRPLLDVEDAGDAIKAMIEAEITRRIDFWAPIHEDMSQWDFVSLTASLNRTFGIEPRMIPTRISKLDRISLPQNMAASRLMEKIQKA